MAIEDFPFREGKAVVLVDDRELKGASSRRLFELGAVLEPQRLPVGDFVCSPRLCIERKTAADFESSVIDGRLFTQAAELSSSFTAAIVAVVGRNFERISPQACRGALLSLVVDYRIPVLFFDSEGELAEFIFAAASREQLAPDRTARLRFEKKRLSEFESRLFVLESLPEVGPKTARALLEEFGTVENVFTAEEEELSQVEGIGEPTARALRKFIGGRAEP